jgi:phage baseplate assembly protein W
MTTATLLTPKPGSYVDVNAYYGTVSGDPLATDAYAASGELYNVMSTLIGDEPFEPTFGSNLPLRVFEPITPGLDALLVQDTYVAGKAWLEPRIKVVLAATEGIAAADQRVAGVSVGYQFDGGVWVQDIHLTRIGT